MELREVLKRMHPSDRVRIYRERSLIFAGYVFLTEEEDINLQQEVERISIGIELRRKDWEQAGLEAPLLKDEAPDYRTQDLQVMCFMDIFTKK